GADAPGHVALLADPRDRGPPAGVGGQVPGRLRTRRLDAGTMDQLSAGAFDLLAAPGHLIRRAQQQHQARWTELVGSGLTSVQFAVLAALDTHPGTAQNTLSTALSIDTSTLAEVCLRLASRGLIERERSEIDARR